MTGERRPLVVTADAELLDDVLGVAAAVGVAVDVAVEPGACGPQWTTAPLVLLGVDLAPALAGSRCCAPGPGCCSSAARPPGGDEGSARQGRASRRSSGCRPTRLCWSSVWRTLLEPPARGRSHRRAARAGRRRRQRPRRGGRPDRSQPRRPRLAGRPRPAGRRCGRRCSARSWPPAPGGTTSARSPAVSPAARCGRPCPRSAASRSSPAAAGRADLAPDRGSRGARRPTRRTGGTVAARSAPLSRRGARRGRVGRRRGAAGRAGRGPCGALAARQLIGRLGRPAPPLRVVVRRGRGGTAATRGGSRRWEPTLAGDYGDEPAVRAALLSGDPRGIVRGHRAGSALPPHPGRLRRLGRGVMNAEVLGRVRRRLVDTGHVPATARAGRDGARGLRRPGRTRPGARPGAGGRVGAGRRGAAGAAAAGRRDHRRPGQCAGQRLGRPGLRAAAGAAAVSRRGGGPRSRPAAGRPGRPAAGRRQLHGSTPRFRTGRGCMRCCRPSRSAAPACPCAPSARAASRWPSWIGPARCHAGPPVWSSRWYARERHSWSVAAPAPGRPPSSGRCWASSNPPSGSCWSRMRPSCAPLTRTSSGSPRRPPNVEGAGEVSLRDLVRQALRMRPDRLVVGEVRGAEVVELLTALNTGHAGSAGTLHANSAGELPARLEALGALGQLERHALHSQVAAALQVALHLARFSGRPPGADRGGGLPPRRRAGAGGAGMASRQGTGRRLAGPGRACSTFAVGGSHERASPGCSPCSPSLWSWPRGRRRRSRASARSIRTRPAPTRCARRRITDCRGGGGDAARRPAGCSSA